MDNKLKKQKERVLHLIDADIQALKERKEEVKEAKSFTELMIILGTEL